jgi:hypothetical protein
VEVISFRQDGVEEPWAPQARSRRREIVQKSWSWGRGAGQGARPPRTGGYLYPLPLGQGGRTLNLRPSPCRSGIELNSGSSAAVAVASNLGVAHAENDR